MTQIPYSKAPTLHPRILALTPTCPTCPPTRTPIEYADIYLHNNNNNNNTNIFISYMLHVFVNSTL